MPAYNGIRGYWNEVRVNSNYKSKNAVPQGTELEAGMQTKMEKKQVWFLENGSSFCNTFFCSTSFCRMQCGTDEPDKNQ
ncbi:MAG: hypothetical protein V8T65_10420 [Roseburia inulinivorans]